MQTVKIKNIEIGKGTPKICVPLVGATREEILMEIAALSDKPVDIVEWRADYFSNTINDILSCLKVIRDNLNKKALLFTFRTEMEGGAKDITQLTYYELNGRVIESGLADIVDIELSMDSNAVKSLVYTANKNDTFTLLSNHDFEKTPNKETIIKRLCQMHELGADIAKIAVMPRSLTDVCTLIGAMTEMVEVYSDKPFVAVSMSRLGFVSRIIGESFGSAITFAVVGKQSAPGQIEAVNLDLMLKLIHESL